MAKKTPAQSVRDKAAVLPSKSLRRGYRQRPARSFSTMKGRVKRRSFYLNFMPSTGMFCIATRDSDRSDITPLACHRSFQDALYDQNIPEHQGVTSRRGSKRNIGCVGSRVTGTDKVPYERSDQLPIFEIARCMNRTKRVAWDPDRGWVEVTDPDLEGLEWPKTAKGAARLGTAAGMALFALPALGLYAWLNSMD